MCVCNEIFQLLMMFKMSSVVEAFQGVYLTMCVSARDLKSLASSADLWSSS